ncbi:hypothetical protein TPB0596_32730 [Tsukamurella pulmonis]|uniref:Uncharacterized protein n=1 Tax=Tsukamurella pulmonis TaxID=47312 RepID=A0A1H1DAH4_9ACTN|nr:hypothetical protein [Tsukamurella pulmonis]KXO92416.1 hypothetical protein AXK56_04980 [Tsukamurella pulmonis]BDD83510.1 hypothetical protein TPB0596_32730 [Tsukamurella pulmonis]SDQ73453.1 hypothetical protein SAMN04489765_1629 [Tsukamurella pulmonis]SUP22278.1 Uncharacterised protein [Tsukamurella pulmonis]
MADPELARIIDEAQAAIKDRPNMVSDGNPQEELARAFERHASRLMQAARDVREVGIQNFLGPTDEGEAASYNIRLGAVEHDQSIRTTFIDQATQAKSLAASFRSIGREILRTEGRSEEEINRVIGQ